jgi:release factor glutamine methyltransferase
MLSVPTESLSSHVSRAAAAIAHAGVSADNSRLDAVVLARWALGWDAATWLARNHDPAPGDFAARFDAAVERRSRREPVAYITGMREFYGRDFVVTPDVLVPRPETELLIDEALIRLGDLKGSLPDLKVRPTYEVRPTSGVRPTYVDVGTGSGCIAITLALECPDARVVAIDSSAAALDVARENATRLGAGDIEFRLGDLLTGLDAPVDLIVSNPPYVRECDRESLQPEVARFEPAGALFAGPDGLDVVRALVPAAAALLAPRGWLIFEFGNAQDDGVSAILAAVPALDLVAIRPDLQGIPRCVVAQRVDRRSAVA